VGKSKIPYNKQEKAAMHLRLQRQGVVASRQMENVSEASTNLKKEHSRENRPEKTKR